MRLTSKQLRAIAPTRANGLAKKVTARSASAALKHLTGEGWLAEYRAWIGQADAALRPMHQEAIQVVDALRGAATSRPSSTALRTTPWPCSIASPRGTSPSSCSTSISSRARSGSD